MDAPAPTSPPAAPRVGIALGSGSARGWAHIGVLRALAALDIHPEIVCGTSIGALVGAAYAAERLDALERWVLDIDRWQVLRFINPGSGGLVESERLMQAFGEQVEDCAIDSLPRRYACVATELHSGRERWLRRGSLLDAVRASIALPGLLRPVYRDAVWLVDGGLVDPVPVSLCRALGAEVVIAVNLNGELVGRPPARPRSRAAELLEPVAGRLQELLGLGREAAPPDTPGLFEVLGGALHIMQDRITRSRMAGDPPDVLLAPRLGQIALFEFDRAPEAIAVGRAAVEQNRSALFAALGRPEPDPA
ncbi:NTE family protein [Plasticicumulans lactativorans]|uniref:NTE family protein n=1 Tax=Plasticicumulans lactativorans TaxID=1133106 RepID=A0A4V2SDB0_9GAMM|nr:patatin-like phospholipase family protein [Plasticicumulans lactativorans]TCO82723.1 NTE family protein [Plasticicumulans lactativorans]